MQKASRPRSPNGFPTVGLLLADMHTGASCSLWPGVADAAAREGVNLVFFPGGRLRVGPSPDALRNSVYALAGPGCLEGLVSWPSSLAGGLEARALDAFHARYDPLPLVCIAQSVRGAPTVAMDAYAGMREVIGHLLECHGLRRIAFVRGPATHPSAEDRFRAYRDALAEAGIAVDDALVTSPLQWAEGADAVRVLVDERRLAPGRDFQAVAAASDLLALWSLKSFQERGVRVPGDIIMAGFNDTAESRLSTPPLTTAAVPFAAQGGRAVEMLVAVMAGRRVPRSVTVPVHLVVRRSCGCPSAAVSLAGAPLRLRTGAAGDPAASLRRQREECLVELTGLTGVGQEGRTAWIEPLLESFMDDLPGFCRMLDSVLDRAILADNEIDAWQDAASALRRRVLALLPASERGDMEDLFSEVRVLIAEAAGRQRTWRQWRADRLAQSVRETSAALLSAFDVSGIADVLAECLPRLGIPSYALALYEDASDGRGSGVDGRLARLVLAGTEKGRSRLPPEGVLFPSDLLVPRDCLPRTRRYDLVVEPLYFHDQELGFAVLEIGPRDGALYEQLRGAIASALKGALLLQEARDARALAEKADLIKTRLLANVSHELRAPLGIILQQVQAAREAQTGSDARASSSRDSLDIITSSAEHQLRVINDLLDLSRADINELDLDLSVVDPRSLLEEVFRGITAQAESREGVTLEWNVPARLPVLRADPVRLRQILFNLLGNALKFTEKGRIALSAEVRPPSLLVRVADTGPGIEPGMAERIFEPFVTAAGSGRGIGLGLAISRHLAELHGGELTVQSSPGAGAEFTLRLPLPGLTDCAGAPSAHPEPVLLVVSHAASPAPEIAELCKRQGLRMVRAAADGALEGSLDSLRPAALAWDIARADPEDWPLLRQLRRHPRFSQLPMLLYGDAASDAPAGIGITGLLPKHAAGSTVMDLIEAASPRAGSGPVLIVDDDPDARAAHAALVRSGLPGRRVRTADDGQAALAAMEEEIPSLVLLDLSMPVMDGADVLDRMRADGRFRRVPVVVLTNRILGDEEVRRLERHARLTVQTKGIWSDQEIIGALHRGLFGSDSLPPQTGALVKRAAAWLARNHARTISRWQLAEAVNASPDYVGRLFRRELGISPVDYLNRYRVHRACELLLKTGGSMKEIAAEVGIHDQAYFTRVFRKITGMTPQNYRNAPGVPVAHQER